MPFVYVLTNESMPGLVKIGMTDDTSTNARIGQLYTTGVPLPFNLEYACEVPNARQVEQALHVAFAPHRINARREFFRMEPEQAIAILRLLDQARDVTTTVAAQPSDIDDVSRAAASAAKSRRPVMNFEEMGIPPGAVLRSVENPDIHVYTAGGRYVWLNDERVFLAAPTAQLLGRTGVRATLYWQYDGRLLSELYDETYSHHD